MRALVLTTHLDFAVPLRAQKDSSSAEKLMDGVDARRESRLLFQNVHVREEGMGIALLLHELCNDHTRFLVSEAFPEEIPASFQRMADEDPVVSRTVGDDDMTAAEGLGGVLLEAVRHGEDDHLQGDRVLRPELRDGGFGEIRDLFAELLQRGDLLGEAPRYADSLAGLDHVFLRDAGDAPQFLPGPVAGQVEEHPDRGLREGHVIPGSPAPHRLQLSHHPAPDAPDILGGELLQDLLDVLRPVHVAAAPELGIALAELRCDLRQCLGGSDAHGHRDGGLPPAFPGDLLGVLVEINLHPVQVQEGLVDGVDLDGRGVIPQYLLHPSGHIAVQREIPGEDMDMVPFHDIPYLEEGIAHLDAERLGLVAPCHRAAVVVAEHDDRPPVQFRTENPFARGEEIVAVGKGVHVMRNQAWAIFFPASRALARSSSQWASLYACLLSDQPSAKSYLE